MLMVEDGENNFKMVKKTMKMKKSTGPRRQVFGPVSTINSAPVAIGNSLRGTKPVVLQSKDGVRVMGRDFAFAAGSTVAAVTDWELIGGMPLSPAVLASSTLRNFNQIYNYFKFNKIVVHYITSSPTSQAGDVMFYVEKNRYNPAPDHTNSNFLNFVLSDVQTVIGPQWANHSAIITPCKDFKTTSYAITTDMDDDNQGAIYFYSKTNAANSPGYILIDYDITFKELSISPRAGQFPVVRGLFNPLCIGLSNVSVTIGSTNATNIAVQGNTPNGKASALPATTVGGDVYKFVCSITSSTASGVNAAWSNSAGTAPTSSNLFVTVDDVDVPFVIDDGTTLYLRAYDVTVGTAKNYVIGVYPTAELAIADSRPLKYGLTSTLTYNLCGTISLVSSSNNTIQQSTY
jgi:hypothetical protein